MHLSQKIQKAIAENQYVLTALKLKGKEKSWDYFTRTQFNLVARVINKQISKEVIANPDLVEMGLIIGRQQLNSHMETLRCHNVYDFIKYLGNMGEYRVFNWISGKTLQSYWNGGEAKYVKVNALLVFLQVPFNNWDAWQKETGKSTSPYRHNLAKAPLGGTGLSKTSISVIKSYFLGNYFLYYQKTDGSKNVIKTPFILKENESGQVIVRSVSEGHRYSGKVIGIRDGCLYINCQNLDFEEMEQYVFNLGLETKYSAIGAVRGLGAMMAFELVKNGDPFKPDDALCKKIIGYCAERGLIVINAGVNGNVIRVLSPLIIDENLLNKGLDIIESGLAELCA
jgi:hypothetical protein